MSLFLRKLATLLILLNIFSYLSCEKSATEPDDNNVPELIEIGDPLKRLKKTTVNRVHMAVTTTLLMVKIIKVDLQYTLTWN